MQSVAAIVRWSRQAFPDRLAEGWDAVGLVCGREEWPVSRVLVAVDVTEAVVAEAESLGCGLILAHHPLLFRAVHSVAGNRTAGDLLTRLIEMRCALLTVHTNADRASPGVSDALAAALGVADVRPIAPAAGPDIDKLTAFVPHENAPVLLDALASAGAGRVGAYERCAYMTDGRGTFIPGRDANPTIGMVGEVALVDEVRLEMVFPRERRGAVVDALRAAHVYEEPAFDVVELSGSDSTEGLGRVGVLQDAMPLAEFAAHVARSVPGAAQGVKFAGDPQRRISRVAVCGGAGGSLLAAATQAGADAYVTADLGHHSVADHMAAGGCAVVDIAHWASESPWTWQVAEQLAGAFDAAGGVETIVSEVRTDPWTGAVGGAT